MLPSTADRRFRGTVGSAFDYRVRFYFPIDPTKKLVAGLGAGRIFLDLDAEGRRGVALSVVQRVKWMMDNLAELLHTIIPGPQRLDEETERLLCRYCAVLAELEAAYRSPFYRPQFPASRGKTRSGYESEPLLAMAAPEVTDDLMLLSRSVPETFGPIIDAVMQSVPYVPNPTFAGSSDVGGADADLIVGDTIFELKTASALDAGAVRDALVQLVGYALLDYDDSFGIRNVGVYFARHRWVASWPLWRLVFPVAEVIRHLDETEPTEAEVTSRLAEGRAGMREAGTGPLGREPTPRAVDRE